MQENSSLNSDVQYNLGRKSRFLLMGLLVILNIVIRIPSIPHEKGFDSFFIHSLANSVTNFGVAKWWINWMSVFGLYPYSYASAVPFTLSGMSQLTGIRMEIVILLFCVILGLFSIFASYSLATVLYDNFLNRFLFAAIYSLSAGTLNLTTWEITTRAQVLVLFPFLLYLVLNIVKFRVKFLLLYTMIIVMFFATHHFVYIALLFSGIIFIYSMSYNFYQKNVYLYRSFQGVKLKTINFNYIYILIVVLSFSLVFLRGAELGLITAGSRYTWIIDVIMISIRNSGFVFPLSISGFIYYTFKKKKSFEEWTVLVCLVPTLVLSFNHTYGYLVTYIFIILLGSIGIFNIIKNYKQNTKQIVFVVVLVLVLNVMFSSFFSHFRLGLGGGYSEWYMREETYITGKWIKENINRESKAASNSVECIRLFASYGGRPALYQDDINNYMNGFIKFNESNIQKNSIFSKNYYLDNPYVLKPGTSSSGHYKWTSLNPITDTRSKDFIKKNNISYFFDDAYVTNALFSSLPQNKNIIYNSGRMRVWEN